MANLSKQARGLCAQWFSGPDKVLISDLPHETLNSIKDAMAELVAAGIVTQDPYPLGSPVGRLVFRGSPEAARIGREVTMAHLARSLFPSPTPEP